MKGPTATPYLVWQLGGLSHTDLCQFEWGLFEKNTFLLLLLLYPNSSKAIPNIMDMQAKLDQTQWFDSMRKLLDHVLAIWVFTFCHKRIVVVLHNCDLYFNTSRLNIIGKTHFFSHKRVQQSLLSQGLLRYLITRPMVSKKKELQLRGADCDSKAGSWSEQVSFFLQ